MDVFHGTSLIQEYLMCRLYIDHLLAMTEENKPLDPSEVQNSSNLVD